MLEVPSSTFVESMLIICRSSPPAGPLPTRRPKSLRTDSLFHSWSRSLCRTCYCSLGVLQPAELVTTHGNSDRVTTTLEHVDLHSLQNCPGKPSCRTRSVCFGLPKNCRALQQHLVGMCTARDEAGWSHHGSRSWPKLFASRRQNGRIALHQS